MSDVLRVRWTITASYSPQPWRHCSRCKTGRAFRCSDLIRLNANGKRLDAWLIYKCTACASTWNRPIIARQSVTGISAELLDSLQRSDQALVRRLANDTAALRRSSDRVEYSAETIVTKETLLEPETPARQLEIGIIVHGPVAMRLDRLLAVELDLPRKRIATLLRAFPRRVRDGLTIIIDLADGDDGARIPALAQGRLT